MVPLYIFLDWHHEFKNDQRSVGVQFVQDNRSNPQKFSYDTENPDEDFGYFGTGVSIRYDNGIQLFANVQTLLGHEFYDSTLLSFGLRKIL